MEENGLTLLKSEMVNEEIQIKVNAIHRLKTVIKSISQDEVVNSLIPYLNGLIGSEEDEVLFAIAEQLGQVFSLVSDKTVFLQLLEQLCKHDETVVREKATESLINIAEYLSEAEIQNVFAQLVLKLSQCEWFPGKLSSCKLFSSCYKRSGSFKERLRKKFIELCNEDTAIIRRACAKELGGFAQQLEKQHILQEILPVFRQLSQDEQDAIRVKCLQSLIPIASIQSQEENKIHTLGTLLAAGEDKSWKVRLAFAENFPQFAESFGGDITDNNLIQAFTLLLEDHEAEVKQAAISRIPQCLSYISTEKILNPLLPAIIRTQGEGNNQYKAGAAEALCYIAKIVGKDATWTNILPILEELLKQGISDIMLNVVNGIKNLTGVLGSDLLKSKLINYLLQDFQNKATKWREWRVRQSVFELLASLGLDFGKEAFVKELQATFILYLTDTAASVRELGVAKSAILAENFSQDWVIKDYIPVVIQNLKVDKKGYNYRMCCLYSLAAIMPFTTKEMISTHIIPEFLQATKDDIPNVKFCVAKIIVKQREYIDESDFCNVLYPPLKEMAGFDVDKDVAYFAGVALKTAN